MSDRTEYPARPDREAELSTLGTRKSSGAYYTPPEVVDLLLRSCLDPIVRERAEEGVEALSAVRILDPSCGTGHFLLAAYDRIHAALAACGLSASEAAERAARSVVGVDRDADAAKICRSALAERSGHLDPRPFERTIRSADSLLLPLYAPAELFAPSEGDKDQLSDWTTFMTDVGAVDGFDLVIGNPPFLGQLRSETAYPPEYLRQLKGRFGESAGGAYVDAAALFLMVGLDVLRPHGGRLCLIEPLSVLSTKGAAPARKRATARAALTRLWLPDEQVFADAAVDVCAITLETGAAQQDVTVMTGLDGRSHRITPPKDTHLPSWSWTVSGARGVPDRRWATVGTLGDIASASADFRDQYYGLIDALIDEPSGEHPRLVTSGLIDPAELLWGRRAATFNRVRRDFPRVRLDLLSDELRSWAARRLVPKVLVATQTKVLEAIVDEDGSLLPSVPVITVEAPAGDLWRIAALLVSPPIAAIAATRHLGAALSADALKLSARDVLALPLPLYSDPWVDAGDVFKAATGAVSAPERRELLVVSARRMCAAFGVDDEELVAWWQARLPRRRDSTRTSS